MQIKPLTLGLARVNTQQREAFITTKVTALSLALGEMYE